MRGRCLCLSTAAGLCARAADQECTKVSAVACPRRSYEATRRAALRCRRPGILNRRHETPPSSDIVAPLGAEHNTLNVAIEISRKSRVIGIESPASERIGLHSLGAADVVGLKDLIEHQQTKAERALGREVRVLCCYEAGYEGFWLARWLERTMSVETVVLDPASLLVNRKAKQRKTDRIDARRMVRALLAHDGGDAAVLSRVRIPSVEEEDRKRLLRERWRLVKERTSLTNAVKGLLKLHGIFDLQPRAKSLEAQFVEVRTAYGSTFPPRARQEIDRAVHRAQINSASLVAVTLSLATIPLSASWAQWQTDTPQRSYGKGPEARPSFRFLGLVAFK